MNKEDILYDKEFGHIPDTQMERIKFILGNKSENEIFNKIILRDARKIKRLKTTKITFTMWKIVKPSARPRANSRGGYIRMYVPGARQAGDWFQQFCEENELPFIQTPCILNMAIYEKTPSSFSIKNKVLAELGIIRPWKRTGDFDNYAKTVADSIQHGMLEDDCLVFSSKIDRYYSIKPHADVEIIYYNEHPLDVLQKGSKKRRK